MHTVQHHFTYTHALKPRLHTHTHTLPSLLPHHQPLLLHCHIQMLYISSPLGLAGHHISLTSPPTPSVVAVLGLSSFSSNPSGPSLPPPTLPSALLSIPTAITDAIESMSTAPPSLSSTRTAVSGIPNLPAKLVQKILVWESFSLSNSTKHQLPPH